MADDLDLIRDQLRITCADAVELMTDLLEDALCTSDRERMAAHLDGCQACAVYLDQIRSTITVLGSIRGADEFGVDPDLIGELAAAFRANSS